ncbi:MAG: Release factor glutamine methyltransferase [Syntrophomonadaceae bacterium]|nr:Release factor glutamine methyltransferase [Bacillota bacterium]
MELSKALEWGTKYLHEHGIENAREGAEYLLLDLLNCSRSSLYLNHNISLSTEELFSFFCFIRERARYVPPQYVTGKTWFSSLPFIVNENVMIPRPETEILVETAIERLSTIDYRLPTILDIGTGCGNIAISLATSISCQVYALDVSCHALNVAKENAKELLDVDSVAFICKDILESEFKLPKNLDLVISNPPYVPHDDIKGLPREVRESEPHMALDGGKDGVKFYPSIVYLASGALSSGGYLALEVGIGQAEKVRKIIFENGSYQQIETVNDYAGIERVIIAKKK